MRLMKLLMVLLACSVALPVIAGPYEDVQARYAKGDYVAAVRLLHILADQGDAWGQYNLGVMTSEGKGLARDYTSAVVWFRKAAAQGLRDAQGSLGFLYASGLGVSQDYARAASWYRRAAQQGDASAQHTIGFMYDNGEGVSQDFVQAHKWYSLAAARFSVDSDEKSFESAITKRRAVTAKMTPDQIAEASTMAREWKPQPELMEALDGSIKCVSRADWWATVVVGPCKAFRPPAHLAVGETFEANGKTRTVGVIIAHEATQDLKGNGVDIKKGEWTCTLGETRQDINTGGDHDALWLYVRSCKPVTLD